MGSREVDRLLKQAVTAARAGHKERARALLLRVIALDEELRTFRDAIARPSAAGASRLPQGEP